MTGPVYPEIYRCPSAVNANGNIEAERCLIRSVHHINPFNMASTDTIEQLASNLTAKLHDVDVPDIPAELGALLNEVRKWMRRQQRRFAEAREERLRATIRALKLTEDQDVERNFSDCSCNTVAGRIKPVGRQTREHTNRLWVALKPVSVCTSGIPDIGIVDD
ncbi:hypothetical protein ARMGADRAFT_1029683 [Armillaria gallica]|uniref:Uncharacterized protein n=1 Tax=Armillaria gallica TaxID=47427 RepID=A0A2H3E288_ARMGA|nr:hypothetical protein ARMGADRAFT_1029683 [Armillaria gallica]